ncbi:MAG: transcription factor [Sphingomonas taxi]|uniref:Transcription factor n=1 Tax=Sphingomonas taxi TaxID=1549858 RepID=A0A2W5QUR1_9SPHN|nr:MAG: transcription factor [Sphingomonas taxi]
MASLYIKDQEVNALAEELAQRRVITKTAAVKLALQHELAAVDRRYTREKMLDLWERHPLQAPVGPIADKAFFDDLSGGL